MYPIIILLILFLFFIRLLDNKRKISSINSIEELGLYIDLIDTYGNQSKINVCFNDSEGKTYLPNFSYIQSAKLCWNNDYKIKLEDDTKKYRNKEFDIKDGKDEISLVALCGKKEFAFSLLVLNGSCNVKPLFINVDEDLGSIRDMNNDENHNKECFGKAIFDNNESYVSIKGRGNSTWLQEKKPYNITFFKDEYVTKKSESMIDGVQSKKWTLLANYADPTLLRNHIGYDLAQNMDIGLPSKYYDVWLNGEYLGNYLVTPKNDYKAPKDGFILELDNGIDNEDPQFNIQYNGEEIESLLLTVKSNEGNVDILKIKSFMQDVWQAIENYDTEDYQNYIDIESWAKLYLLYEIDKNSDAINGSIYMYRNSVNESDKLMAGPVWDLDCSFGRVYSDLNADYCVASMSSEGHYLLEASERNNKVSFLNELGKHDSFLEEVKKMKSVYNNDIKNVINKIKTVYDDIYQSAMMDFDKWNYNENEFNCYKLNQDVWYFDGKAYFEYPEEKSNDYRLVGYSITKDYSQYAANLISFVNARINYLNVQLDK